MPKYSVSIEVKAQRIPEPQHEEPALKPGEDPMAVMTNFAKSALSGAPLMMPMPQRPSGAEMSRSITVTAESFTAIAGILGKFDELAERIERENP